MSEKGQGYADYRIRLIEIEGDCVSGDPMDETSGGVKVLSEKTVNDKNFYNDRMVIRIDSGKRRNFVG